MRRMFMATCAWCGKDLGYERKFRDEPELCGAADCNRGIERTYEMNRAERRDRAKADDFERY